jgi:hypothetical protein
MTIVEMLAIGGVMLLAGLILTTLFVVIVGGVLLWMLNLLGFLLPFSWLKAIALGIILVVIRFFR